MHILMVTLGYPKCPDGPTAPFIEAIARSLVARGHSIDVVLPHHPEFRRQETAAVRYFSYRYSPISRYAPWGFGQSFGAKSRVRLDLVPLLPVIALSLRHTLKRQLLREHYDLIHAHWVMPNGWLASSAAHVFRVPIVITLHGSDVAMAERYRLFRHLARRTFARTDAVTTTSDHLRGRAQALGADPAKASTIYIGVDADLFAPRPPNPGLRARLGAGDDTFLVVSVGRLAEVKGFEHLIAAASLLRGVSIAIVGDGELRAELEERIRVSSAPVKLIGPMAHAEVAAAMAAADAIVVPSVVDRAGRVDATTSTVLEAMASGRPLVATEVGGIPEVVENGLNGLLVPQRDPAALAAAIERLQGDADLRRRISRRGREVVRERLTWSIAAEAFEMTYMRAMSQRAAHQRPRRPR